MSSITSLSNSVINLQAIRDAGRNELEDILQSIPGEKSVVLDTSLSTPLNFITGGAKIFKDNGVVSFSQLSDEPLSGTAKNIVYITRATIALMKQISAQVHTLLEANNEKSIYLYFVPRQSFLCCQILRDEGVYDDLTIGEFHVDLIPIEEDILSMEADNYFREIYLEGDISCLNPIARSILKLQSLYGTIPHIKAKGNYASIVSDMIQRIKKEENLTEGNGIIPEIDTLIILDREVDFVSPFIVPLTYEGLIDEIYTIENSTATVEEDIIGEGNDIKTYKKLADGKVVLPLNSNDKLFNEIRDYHINLVPDYLKDKSKEIKKIFDSRPNKDTDVREIRDFVRKIPGLKDMFGLLQIHINLAEKVTSLTNSREFRQKWESERLCAEGNGDSGEGMLMKIALQDDLVDLLRELCLISVSSGGFKPKIFDAIRRDLIQTYGFELLLTISNLEKIGLLTKKESSNHWVNIRKQFNCINENSVGNDMNDMAYVTSGYAPLSCRLVQYAMNNLWSTKNDVMKLISGPTVEINQQIKAKKNILNDNSGSGVGGVGSGAGGSGAGGSGSGSDKRKVVMVYMIGGISWMEIAALRQLRRMDDFNYDIVIATTKITNGKGLIRSVSERLESKLVEGRT